MCFAKAPKVPAVQAPVDTSGDAAKSAYANQAAARRTAFGDANTDIVGSIVANDNNAKPAVNTQLKKLMGASS